MCLAFFLFLCRCNHLLATHDYKLRDRKEEVLWLLTGLADLLSGLEDVDTSFTPRVAARLLLGNGEGDDIVVSLQGFCSKNEFVDLQT